jgi:hypothetical protein
MSTNETIEIDEFWWAGNDLFFRSGTNIWKCTNAWVEFLNWGQLDMTNDDNGTVEINLSYKISNQPDTSQSS